MLPENLEMLERENLGQSLIQLWQVSWGLFSRASELSGIIGGKN